MRFCEGPAGAGSRLKILARWWGVLQRLTAGNAAGSLAQRDFNRLSRRFADRLQNRRLCEQLCNRDPPVEQKL